MQEEEVDIRPYLGGTVSPPPIKRRRLDSPITKSSTALNAAKELTPTPAAVEAGRIQIHDHLKYFIELFEKTSRDIPHPLEQANPLQPRLSLSAFSSLYTRNSGSPAGHTYIVHQHDHPRAGLHYDLRLQINPSSSCSWSIPYGLPGNPWERRHGRRQAIETRIHCLWNHLIEAASKDTGSMLIWDVGEYEVLPFEEERNSEGKMTDDEAEDESSTDEEIATITNGTTKLSEPEKLERAFRTGEIRLKLHGTRLPPDYTISLRLSKDRGPAARPATISRHASSRTSTPTIAAKPNDQADTGHIDFDEDNFTGTTESVSEIRAQNAYPGSFNTIDSIHQRWWFLALDKTNCGFLRSKTVDGKLKWKPGSEVTRTKYPFFVRGRDWERSIVTGRRAADVLEDEGVIGFVPRSGWTAALS